MQLVILGLLVSVSTTLSQVTMLPRELVAGLGSDAVFSCSSSMRAENVEWLINGTSLNNSNLTGVSPEFKITLRFSGVSAEYNNTVIQCTLNSIQSFDSSTLIVQGLLSMVKHLAVSTSEDQNTIFLNWTAPFTLDVRATLVDITYCVDVVSSTSSATLHSECGITEAEFTYPLPPRSWCHEYNFTVTPVNVAGNGTVKNSQYFQIQSGPELTEVTMSNTTIFLHLSSPVCHAELTIEDIFYDNTANTRTIENQSLILERTTISFDSQLLASNRMYRIKLSASSIHEHASSEAIISTSDILSCSVVEESDGIHVLVNFTEHSEATGALLNFIFINDDGLEIDFKKSFSQIAEKNGVLQDSILPVKLWHPGSYVLYAYDIESNGRIMDGITCQACNSSFRPSINVTNGHGRTPLSSSRNEGFRVTSNGRTISIECLFSRFQAVAQRNVPGSASILHVNTSTNPQTPMSLQVPEDGEYLVTVFHVWDESGILSGLKFSQLHVVEDMSEFTSTIEDSTTSPVLPGSSSLGSIIAQGSGLVALALLSVILSLIVVIQCCKKKFKRHSKQERNKANKVFREVQLYDEIEEQKYEVTAPTPEYEDVKLAVNFNAYEITNNSAYGVSTEN